ncbi:hypothetical protein HMJ29_00815 [Hymenobacter taeanensis]|uniref:Uncharacterized protein n=1 Tax=Hymenobacter taeanensis TaxID=2735321 RepID=A0A6M6BBM8_9BACT|nr:MULTISPECIES: hypothetical protein [Hymenobacter]QJX45557.1 hypothetical protein HMJ29_00815 [Hymenobacter taeanensis]UOQ81194.1 hypothetical protein MUN83_20705 [Hymenobacter sp. 5414T-23]
MLHLQRQVDAQLRKQPTSDLVRTVQVRELLLGHLQHGRVQPIPGLLTYLRENTADTAIHFRPYEEWALLAVSEEFYPLIKQISRFEAGSQPAEAARQYGLLPQDGLFEAATHRVAAREDTLRRAIQQAHFLPEDSTFLQLFVSLLKMREQPTTPAGSTPEVKAFLGQYPDTEYASFLRLFVQPEARPSRFSYGLDFHSGTSILTGNLPTYFRTGANLGHGFELGWDRYQLYLRNYIGLGSVREDFAYRGDWRQGLKVNYFVPEASVGYMVYKSSRLRLTPFAGFSAFFIAPANSQKDNPDNALDMSFRHPLTAGVNLDIKLWQTESYGPTMHETGSWMLKLRAGVRQGQARHHAIFNGSIIYLDLGIGGFGRMMKRVAQ